MTVFRTAIASLALLLALPASATPPSASHRDAVIQLLVSKRGFPARERLLRTGKKAVTNRVLAEIAIDSNVQPRLRLNAIRALEYFPTRRSEEVLMSLLYAKHQKPAFQATCLRALARGFGVRMYFEILPFMRDPAAKVRAGAALALGDVDDARIGGILANHLVHEPDIAVRMAIEAAMKTVADRQRRRQDARRKEP